MRSISVEKILLEFEPEKKSILPALELINSTFSFVDKKAAEKAAEYFGVSLVEIYETASFYDFIKTEKQSFLKIRVCSGSNCSAKDAFLVIQEIENIFHIKEGDLFNPRVSLEIMSCLGRCGEGPIVIVNGKIFTKVTASGVYGILEEYID